MRKKHTQYTADRLLNDDYFLQSELYPTEESRKFWEEAMGADDVLALEVMNARAILATVRRRSDLPSLAGEEEKELWERIERVNRGHARRKNLVLTLLSTAAAVAVLLLAMNYLPWKKEEGADYLALIESAQKLSDDSDDIQLVLSDKQKYNLDGRESAIEYEEDGGVRINSEMVPLKEKVKEEQTFETFNTLIVPAGKRSSLTLSDGTTVWVNSDSKVVYPVKFQSDRREIFVEGEAFLDVAPNADAPFYVRTRDVVVAVLGTRFNVSTHDSRSAAEVVLVSGKVEVKTKGCTSVDVLSPNERYTYDTVTGESAVTRVDDVSLYVAWKDGYYPFASQPMDEVLRKIARYYGVRINWDKKVSALTCSGKLDLRDDPAEVFALLKEAAPICIEKKYEGEYLVSVKP